MPPAAASQSTVYLVASGDLRLAANQECWPAQADMERRLGAALAGFGAQVVRAHPFDPQEGHGFISSQRMGMNVFAGIPREAPLIVAEAVWQYSHHVLAGLRDHTGPILTVANWSGQWPGLVGMLNLNGCLTKIGKTYSTLWSAEFSDDFFLKGLQEWLRSGALTHDASHVRDLDLTRLPAQAVEVGRVQAERLLREKAILGVFDEGCMGMANGIIEDDLLNALGIYKERLSQSALVAAMRGTPDAEARAALDWLVTRGLSFEFGTDEASELTERQVLEQMKMYIAGLRIAHAFGCDAIGIQYQQGLKDMAPASDLAEGLLNNADRPPVWDAAEELYAGRPLPHFNEVDEGAGVDALVTNRVWTALGLDPATTLHDVRWGEAYRDEQLDAFVWTFQISGAMPASHIAGGYGGARSERQPPMYFRLGGGTLKGVGRPGEIVWSRVYIMDGRLHADLGLGSVVKLPEAETARRWRLTSPQWPMVHAVLHGVSRDQFMGRHKANHVQVAYAPEPALALAAKAAMLDALGVSVHLCGETGGT